MAILINNVKNNETIMVNKEHQNIKQYKNLDNILEINNINIKNKFDKTLIVQLQKTLPNVTGQLNQVNINKQINTEAQKTSYFSLQYLYNVCNIKPMESLFNKIKIFVTLPFLLNIIAFILCSLNFNIITKSPETFFILSIISILISIICQIISLNSFNTNNKIKLFFIKNIQVLFCMICVIFYLPIIISNILFLLDLQYENLLFIYSIITGILIIIYSIFFSLKCSLTINYYDVIYKISCDKNDKIIVDIIGIIPVANEGIGELKKYFTNDSENKIFIAMEDNIVQSYIKSKLSH